MEAARWLVALEDDPDDADLRARIAAWRSADPANETAWQDTVHVHGLMAETRPVHATPRKAGAAGARCDPQEPFRHRLAAGVLAAIAAGLLLLFVPGLVVRLQSDQLTATAEVRSVALDDGSVVMLGADSAIAVRYQDAGRDVRLLKGEASFR